MPSLSGGTHWSEEVMAFFHVRSMDLVVPDGEDCDRVNLVADTHLQIIRNQKTRLYGCIDRLQAFPFLDLADDEVRKLHSAPTTNAKDNEGNLNDGEDSLDNETSEAEADLWGTWDWGTDSDTSSYNNNLIDDDYDFFGRNTGSNSSDNFEFAALSSSSNDSETITPEWPPRESRYPSIEFAALITRLNTKFPHAFKGNERTIAHTEDAMGPYIEAADFLTTNAERYRGKWYRKQQRAFDRVTAVRIPNQRRVNRWARQAAEERLLRILNDPDQRIQWAIQQRQAQAVVVNWDKVIKDSGDRMAKRKTYKKTSLANEYCDDLAEDSVLSSKQ